MLRLVRIFGGISWLLVVGLTLFTAETVADELGWTEEVREFVRAGPGAMFSASYESWIAATFWLLTGAVSVSWLEWLFRKYEGRRRQENWLHFTVQMEGEQTEVDKRVGVETMTMLDGQVVGNFYRSDPKVSRNALSIIVQFDCAIEEPCPYVFADRKVIWREVRSGSHYLMLEIDRLSKGDLAFGIIARPKARQGGHKGDGAMKWHDATVLPRETVLEPSRAERPLRRWLRGIGAGTRR